MGWSPVTRYAPGSALSALVLNSAFGKNALLFNYSMFIFLQETQISFDLYAAVICVALKQNKHASELPLLGKNIPKDHDGIFPPVLPTSISVPPIDINLALFPSGNCVIFSIFLDNRLLFYLNDWKDGRSFFRNSYRHLLGRIITWYFNTICSLSDFCQRIASAPDIDYRHSTICVKYQQYRIWWILG